MRAFLDTSVLLKLYHRESDTPELERKFSAAKITHIYLAEISKVEFESALWKKVRTRETTKQDVQTILSLFKKDSKKYAFVATNSVIFTQAKILLEKYGTDGLRTLDSIQLTTAITLSRTAEVFLTTDKLLKSFFMAEGLPIEIPGQ